jgi:hypothetical protein
VFKKEEKDGEIVLLFFVGFFLKSQNGSGAYPQGVVGWEGAVAGGVSDTEHARMSQCLRRLVLQGPYMEIWAASRSGFADMPPVRGRAGRAAVTSAVVRRGGSGELP